MKNKGEKANGARAEEEEVSFPDAVGARCVIRHVFNSLGKVCPAKVRDIHGSGLSEKHAEFLQEGVEHEFLSGGIDVASINLSHGLPNHSVHLKGVSIDGGVGAIAFPDPDKRRTA